MPNRGWLAPTGANRGWLAPTGAPPTGANRGWLAPTGAVGGRHRRGPVGGPTGAGGRQAAAARATTNFRARSSWRRVMKNRSTDPTDAILGRLARHDARVQSLRADELPGNWLGKCHACHLGAGSARGNGFLFTDADCWSKPDVIARTSGAAEREGADHLTLTPGISASNLVAHAWHLAFPRRGIPLGDDRQGHDPSHGAARFRRGQFPSGDGIGCGLGKRVAVVPRHRQGASRNCGRLAAGLAMLTIGLPAYVLARRLGWGGASALLTQRPAQSPTLPRPVVFRRRRWRRHETADDSCQQMSLFRPTKPPQRDFSKRRQLARRAERASGE